MGEELPLRVVNVQGRGQFRTESFESFLRGMLREDPNPELSTDPMFYTIVQGQLDVIEGLRAVPDSRTVFVSVDRHGGVSLSAEDREEAEVFAWTEVWIFSRKEGTEPKIDFHTAYRTPDRLAPWPKSKPLCWVDNGHADSLEDAVRMLVTAMDRSEGWLTLTDSTSATIQANNA